MVVTAQEARTNWETAYQRSRSLIAGLTPAQLDQPVPGMKWSARNLASHLASLDAIVEQAGKPVTQGKRFPPLPLPVSMVRMLGNMLNAREVKRTAAAGSDNLVSAGDQRHAAMVAYLDSVQPKDWERTGTVGWLGKVNLAQVVQSVAEHHAEHQAALRTLTAG